MAEWFKDHPIIDPGKLALAAGIDQEDLVKQINSRYIKQEMLKSVKEIIEDYGYGYY